MTVTLGGRVELAESSVFPACHRSARSCSNASLVNVTVLVVDDDPNTRRLLTGMLAYEGFVTLEAMTGEQALHMVPEHAPDVVLLDLALPRLSGLDVLRTLKTRYRPAPRVILVSAYVELVSEPDRRLADGLVAKPFDVDDLLKTIDPGRTTSHGCACDRNASSGSASCKSKPRTSGAAEQPSN